MAVLWLHIDNFDISLAVSLNVEELAMTVMPDVDPQGSRRLLPAGLNERTDFCPSTSLSNFVLMRDASIGRRTRKREEGFTLL